MGVVDDDEVCKRWSFPPVLDQFDLMDTETDPTELEAIFTDERYSQFRPPLVYMYFESTRVGSACN